MGHWHEKVRRSSLIAVSLDLALSQVDPFGAPISTMVQAAPVGAFLVQDVANGKYVMPRVPEYRGNCD
jgi:hypothetical protein